MHIINRHRMRTPMFSESTFCLHKMASSEGHFLLVPIPRATKFARPQVVKLFTFLAIFCAMFYDKKTSLSIVYIKNCMKLTLIDDFDKLTWVMNRR